MLSIYNILSAIAVLLYSPWILFKKGPEDQSVFIRERFGFSEYKKVDIWVHAVSVGEVLACIPFLKALRGELTGKKIAMSTTTYTGQKIARERFPEADIIMYAPVDSPICTRRVVNSLKPEIFITVETELWPSLFQALNQAGSHIIILNGRISSESYKGYRTIKFLMKKVLSKVDYFFMQNAVDAERITKLGADKNKVGVMGNFKFDMQLDQSTNLDWLEGAHRDILLAASTHKGEEELILEAYSRIKKSNRHLRLIIAPRHPERFGEVAELLESGNYQYIKRSELRKTGDRSQESGVRGQEEGGRSKDSGVREQGTDDRDLPDIILLDTMGELSRVFSRVTIAFIGGSLVPAGGHNILEPAYWSKPIIFGPFMDNFPFAKDFLESSAARQVRNIDDMVATVEDFLDNREGAVTTGKNAKLLFDKNTGAVKKAIELVRGYIGTV